jgi:hypothetical protein
VFNAFEEIFAPGRKHTDDERNRLALTRVDTADGDPGRGPIDLASGKVTVRAQTPRPNADDVPADAPADDVPAEAAGHRAVSPGPGRRRTPRTTTRRGGPAPGGRATQAGTATGTGRQPGRRPAPRKRQERASPVPVSGAAEAARPCTRRTPWPHNAPDAPLGAAGRRRRGDGPGIAPTAGRRGSVRPGRTAMLGLRLNLTGAGLRPGPWAAGPPPAPVPSPVPVPPSGPVPARRLPRPAGRA